MKTLSSVETIASCLCRPKELMKLYMNYNISYPIILLTSTQDNYISLNNPDKVTFHATTPYDDAYNFQDGE